MKIGYNYRLFLMIWIIAVLFLMGHSQSDPCQGGRPQTNLKICNISCILEEDEPLNNMPILVHYIVNCTGKDMGSNPTIKFHFNDSIQLYMEPIVIFPDENNHIVAKPTIKTLQGGKIDLIIALHDKECFDEVFPTDIYLNLFVPWYSSCRSFNLMHSSFLDLDDAPRDNKNRVPCILRILSRPSISNFREINGRTKISPGDNLTFSFYLADNDSNAATVSLWDNDDLIQSHKYSITPGHRDSYCISYNTDNIVRNYNIRASVVDDDSLNGTSNFWNISASNRTAPSISEFNTSKHHPPPGRMGNDPNHPDNIEIISTFLLLFLLSVIVCFVNNNYSNLSKYLCVILIVFDIILFIYILVCHSSPLLAFLFKVWVYIICLIIVDFYVLTMGQNASNASLLLHINLFGTLCTSMINLIMLLSFALISFIDLNQILSTIDVILEFYGFVIAIALGLFIHFKEHNANSAYGPIIQRLRYLFGSMLISSVCGIFIDLSRQANPSMDVLKYLAYFAHNYITLMLIPLLIISILYNRDG